MNMFRPLTYCLVILLVLPAFIAPRGIGVGQVSPMAVVDVDGWKLVQTDVVTVMFPANGSKPVFIWWYTADNTTVYVVHFKGLIEYYRLNKTFSRKWLADQVLAEALADRAAVPEAVRELMSYIKAMSSKLTQVPSLLAAGQYDEALEAITDVEEAAKELKAWAEEQGLEDLAVKVPDLLDALGDLEEAVEKLKMGVPGAYGMAMSVYGQVMMVVHTLWTSCAQHIADQARKTGVLGQVLHELAVSMHPPLLPFDGCFWELEGPEEFTDDRGNPVGLAFAFRLVECPIPKFSFVEDNVTIRCRLYYVAAEESVDELINYTVAPGELKIDLLVDGWVWNVDLIQEALEKLREEGFEVADLDYDKAGLGLWLTAASLNASELEFPDEYLEAARAVGLKGSVADSGGRVVRNLRCLKRLVSETVRNVSDTLSWVEGAVSSEEVDWDAVQAVIEGVEADLSSLLSSVDSLKEAFEKESDLNVTADVEQALNECVATLNEVETLLEATLSRLDEAYDAAGRGDRDVVLDAVDEVEEDLGEVYELVSTLLTSVEETLPAMVAGVEAPMAGRVAGTMMVADGVKLNLMGEGGYGEERRLDLVSKRDLAKLSFATEETTLAGWIKFMNASLQRYPNGTVVVAPVKAAYIEAGGSIMLFFLYGYFDEASLEHDPSIGLDVEETTSPEALKPKYTTTAPETGEVTPSVHTRHGVNPYLYVAVAVAAAVAVVAVVLLRRR